MNDIVDISSIYGIVEELARKSTDYTTSELAALEREKTKATQDLQKEYDGIREWLDGLRSARNASDDESVVNSLIHLRIHVMDVATAFDNLAAEIATIFERNAIRKKSRTV